MKKENLTKFISIIFAIISYLTLIFTCNLESYNILSLIIFCFLVSIFVKYFKLEKDNKDLKELRKDTEKEQREMSKEIDKYVNEYIENISTPTGINFWDEL